MSGVNAGQEPLMEILGLKTCFDTDEGIIVAVDGIDLSIRRGESFGLVGESGCGKSVTALSIMRLIRRPGKITEGRVVLNGINLLELNEADMRSVRGKKVSMIFQEPMTSLNPVFSIGEQIREVIVAHENMSNAASKERAIEMLRLVGIPNPEKRYRSYPHEFSGGMRQRVMIAMALALEPDLLIADEPTTALDVTIQAQMLDLISTLKAKMGMAMLLITHDLGVVAEVAHRVAVMYAGKIVEIASVQDIFYQPMHPYTRGLISSIPTLQMNRNEPLNVINGVVPNLGNMPRGCRFAPRCSFAVSNCKNGEPEVRSVGDDHQVSCCLY